MVSMQAPHFLEWEFYHNPVQSWVIAAIVAAVIAAALFVMRTLLARRLAKVAEATATIADDAVVDLLRRTRSYFILAAAIAGGLMFLDLPPRAYSIGRVLGTIALIVQIAIWGNGLITFWFRDYAERKAATDMASRTTIAALTNVAVPNGLGTVASPARVASFSCERPRLRRQRRRSGPNDAWAVEVTAMARR